MARIMLQLPRIAGRRRKVKSRSLSQKELRSGAVLKRCLDQEHLPTYTTLVGGGIFWCHACHTCHGRHGRHATVTDSVIVSDRDSVIRL